MNERKFIGNRAIYKEEFRGKEYIHFREFYSNDEGELLPTKRGVTFLPSQLDDIISILEEIKAE